MFGRMVRGTLFRQWKKMIMIALTIALGASLATAMISVVLDVGDKVNQELKTYGANIKVMPKSASIVDNLYDVENGSAKSYLREEELPQIKNIFWAFNIVDFSPFLETEVDLGEDSKVKAVGTWFNHEVVSDSGGREKDGIQALRTWWSVKGRWIDEAKDGEARVAMVGKNLAAARGYQVGDKISLKGSKAQGDFQIVGIYEAGDEEDDQIYLDLEQVQALAGLDGSVDSIEVSALTTPDNELAIRAAKDPDSLTNAQRELWYCTAYVSTVCYQIQEVISDSVASAVRQVADSEGAILDKTQLLMILIMI
nr:ABC transporter permease [Eubacterium sp.]